MSFLRSVDEEDSESPLKEVLWLNDAGIQEEVWAESDSRTREHEDKPESHEELSEGYVICWENVK